MIAFFGKVVKGARPICTECTLFCKNAALRVMPWHPPIAAQCNDAATVCDTSEGWSADIEKEVSPQIGNSPFHNEVIYSGKQ